METDAPPVPRVPAQRQATQRLTGCSSASQQRKCGSPTRAPSGGSLSQSGSRAKSAEEEEWSQAAPRCQAPSAAEIGASANKSSDLEEGEVPATPPPGRDEDDSDECQLKTTILEQQVTSLRKTNAKLLLRLKDHDKRHTKKYAALLEENLSLRKRLKELSKMEKSRVEEIEELTEESRRLATRLEKSKTKRKEATRDLNDKVDKLTAKVEFQKQNLTGLKSKLWKFTHSDSSPTFTVNERKEPESSSSVEGCSSESYRKLRTRIQNQTEQLAHLNAVLTRERHVAESLVFQLKVLGHQPKTQSCVMTETGPLPASFKHQAHSTWVPPDMTPMKSGDDPNLNVKFQEGSFESSILKVVTNAFPLARRVMKNYEELSACLPTLTPPVMAAIAAMPPATRSLCLGQMKAMPGQQLTSADKEKDLDLPLEKQDSHAMMVRFLSSVLPCPPHGAENGSGQTQPGISASPEAAFGTGPSLALKAEQFTAGNEEPSSRTLPPARAYGPEMPVSVVEGARSQESGFGEETARIKVEVPSLPPPSMAETEPATSKAPCSNAAESAASDSPAGLSAAHHPESQSVQPALGVPEGSRTPLLGSGSHSEACCVPAAVAYPLPLHEGHKQHIDSVHPGFHAAGAAVPCFSGCIPGSRKRLSQDEVCDLERSARIASEIQIMKKRIVKHLQLDRK